MPGQLKVEGARRLRSTLKKAGADLGDLRLANLDAAEVVKDAAVPLTPFRSGRLRASVRAGATRRAGIVRAGKKLVPYAAPIHWGWPARGIKASLWITKAAQETEPIWTKEYEKHVKRIIKSVKGLK